MLSPDTRSTKQTAAASSNQARADQTRTSILKRPRHPQGRLRTWLLAGAAATFGNPGVSSAQGQNPAPTAPRQQGASLQVGAPQAINPQQLSVELDRARSEISGYLPELVDENLERALARAASRRGVKVQLVILSGSRQRNDSRMNNLVLAGYDPGVERVKFREIKLRGDQGEAFLIIDGQRMIYGNELGYTGGSG